MSKKIEESTQNNNKAGNILTKNVPVFHLDEKVGRVESVVLNKINEFDTINYIYVIDAHDHLKGVISIKELYSQKKEKEIKKVMIHDPISARSSTSQERIAYLALKNNIKAVPITDKDGIFQGVVQSDNILNIIFDEAQQDILHIAGVSGYKKGFQDFSKISVFNSFKHRFPWLLVGLLGGIAIAKIINVFETTLSENLIIVSFMPLIVYMAGATGTQMGTLIIRDLAFNSNLKFLKYFVRQFFVISLMAVMASFLFLLINVFIGNGLGLAIVLSLAMFVAILSSIITGILVPYALSRLKIDPANASGPLATIIQDTMSVVIYFTVASVLL